MNDASLESRPAVWLAGVSTLVVLSVVVLNAWVCDDAFITLRTVAQFWSGHGLVFNQGWRVQAYTHPLWMGAMLVLYGLTREAFWTVLLLGACVTGSAVYLASRQLPRVWALAILVTGLASSRAFVEYSSSGLENPATHLVVVAGLGLVLASRASAEQHLRGIRRAGVLLALGFGCRPDAVLLVAPLVLVLVVNARREGLALREWVWALLPGAILVGLWESFSLLYYGALLPNTALAKLTGTIAPAELWARGAAYVWHSSRADPVTGVLVFVALAGPWIPRGPRQLRPLSLGAALYLVYVVAIGGDFMQGRFLTAPALIGALVLAHVEPASVNWKRSAGFALGLGLLAGLGTRHPWLPDRGEQPPRMVDGVADERSYYAKHAAVLRYSSEHGLPHHPWRDQAEAHDPRAQPVVQFNTMGYFGFHVAPEVHVVDAFALADPLLARIPPVHRIAWKPGHLARIIPEGYLESLATGSNQLEDPALAALYEDLALLHRAPVFAQGRLAAIGRVWRGRWAEGFEPERYALAELRELPLRRLQGRRRKPLRFRDAGVELTLPEPRALEAIEVELSTGQSYMLQWRRGGEVLASESFTVLGSTARVGAVELRAPTAADTIDALRLVPLTMDTRRSLELWRVSELGGAH